MTKKVLEELLTLVEKDIDDPDEKLERPECVFDNYGSNVDDAFDGGVRFGREELARELHKLLTERIQQAELSAPDRAGGEE